jgi:hypothetical protein
MNHEGHEGKNTKNGICAPREAPVLSLPFSFVFFVNFVVKTPVTHPAPPPKSQASQRAAAG